jgi:acetyl-CoA carboxylase biotin carboxyl carrier protein
MATRPGKVRPGKSKGEGPVADEPARSPGPFDLATVQALVALMTEHDLSEVSLRSGDQRIRLRRGHAPIVAGVPPAVPPANTAVATLPKTESAAAPPPSKKLIEIKSPTPGTFYAATSPDAQPFVRVGSKVTTATVVCLIEAMKIFNEIPADCTGVIAEILVENQQPVEYGQVLFRVDPTA